LPDLNPVDSDTSYDISTQTELIFNQFVSLTAGAHRQP